MRTKLIFVCGDIEVYAAHFTAEDRIRDTEFYQDIEDAAEKAGLDEYEKAMDRWNDPEYLHRFFTRYRPDLSEHSPGTSIQQAVGKTFDEAADLDQEFLDLSAGEDETRMDALFQPLHKSQREIPRYLGQTMKVYGAARKSWLRLYAIRYGSCYLITGGAIKLTQTMNTRPHLEAEKYKLRYAAKTVGIEAGVQGFIDIYGEEE